MQWLGVNGDSVDSESYEWYVDEPNSPVWSMDGSTDGMSPRRPSPIMGSTEQEIAQGRDPSETEDEDDGGWTLTTHSSTDEERDKYDHIDWERTWANDASRNARRTGTARFVTPPGPAAPFVAPIQDNRYNGRPSAALGSMGAGTGSGHAHPGNRNVAPPSRILPTIDVTMRTGGALAPVEPTDGPSLAAWRLAQKQRTHHLQHRSTQLSSAVTKRPKVKVKMEPSLAKEAVATLAELHQSRPSRVRAANRKYSGGAYDISRADAGDSVIRSSSDSSSGATPTMPQSSVAVQRRTLSEEALAELHPVIAKIVVAADGRILSVGEAAFILAAGRDTGINSATACSGKRPLTQTQAWALFVEPLKMSRPCRPTQSNDQWRNSGGASGATEMMAEDGTIVVRRYGLVRRREEGDALRYHEYSFKFKGDHDVRVFHTMPGRGTPGRSTPGYEPYK